MNIYFIYKITLVNYCEILKLTQRLLAVGNSCAVMNCWNIESYLAKTWQVCWLCWNRKFFKLEKIFRRYIQVYIYYRKKTMTIWTDKAYKRLYFSSIKLLKIFWIDSLSPEEKETKWSTHSPTTTPAPPMRGAPHPEQGLLLLSCPC